MATKKDKYNFTLSEMFVIYTISKKVQFLSHKIGFKKLINSFTENKTFCRLIELADLIDKNNTEINKKYTSENEVIRAKLLPYNGKETKEIPVDLLKEWNDLKIKIDTEQKETNKDLGDEFETLVVDTKEFSFQVNDLARKGILNFVESQETKVQDLGLTEQGGEKLIEVYTKLEQGNGSIN